MFRNFAQQRSVHELSTRLTMQILFKKDIAEFAFVAFHLSYSLYFVNV